MEYISYILVTLGIMVACLLLMRLPALPEQSKYNGKPVINSASEKDHPINANNPDDARRARLVLRRELLHVPTPWGWPGHQRPASASSRIDASPNSQEVHGAGESIYHFVDRLFSEKHTVDSQEYLLRKDASLRAMVEDHFGRACTMQEIRYRAVKPPRLRNPAEPHDQMDNFPSGKVDQIAARIPKQPKFTRVLKPQTPVRKTVGLEDIKTPWGW
jgi:hypothetical protein